MAALKCYSIIVPFVLFAMFCGDSQAKVARFPLLKHTPDTSNKHKRKEIPIGEVYNISMGGGLGPGLNGEYVIEISIGVPEQIFRVQVDTGSSDLLVPVPSCTFPCGKRTDCSCPHTDAFYNSSASSTSSYAPCTPSCDHECTAAGYKCVIDELYADGSNVLAYAINDVMHIPTPTGSTQVKITFGEIVRESSSFAVLGIDGIIGLAYQSISAGGTVPVFDSLVAAGMSNVFSMCMGYESNGALLLGGIDETYMTAPPVYVPIVTESWYVISPRGMRVGSTSGSPMLSFEKGVTTIVDSGTTLLQLTPSLFSSMLQSLRNIMCVNGSAASSACSARGILNGFVAVVSPAELLQYPSLDFVFPGMDGGADVVVSLPANMYLVNASASLQNARGLGIYSLDGQFVVFGDVFMKAFYVIFDREKKRIGFAPPNYDACSKNYTGGQPQPTYTVTSAPTQNKESLFIAMIVISAALVNGMIAAACVMRLCMRPMEPPQQYTRIPQQP